MNEQKYFSKKNGAFHFIEHQAVTFHTPNSVRCSMFVDLH